MSTELHFFDPRSDYSVLERQLPHWSQPGVVCFITLRTNDSMPKALLEQWREERWKWLRSHGINPRALDWRPQLERLCTESRREFFQHFSGRWHEELDAGHGSCVLKNPEVTKIVAESLQKFDGHRYDLTDFVVMPNHVHMLAAFDTESAMLEQCENWKHYQATQINRLLNSSGRFWQQDGFDHLVRSSEQFDHFRRYISENPKKANLQPGTAYVWSKPLG